jgi:hypothetical protein
MENNPGLNSTETFFTRCNTEPLADQLSDHLYGIAGPT